MIMEIEVKLVKVGDEYGFEVSEIVVKERLFEEGKEYKLKI